MRKKIEEHVLNILNKYSIDPKRACWDCHDTLVIYHRYLERIADAAGITFDDPDVKVLDMDRKMACMFVRGHLGDSTAWSFGEVTPKNCTNDYPVAMAEKRAKDRVILKLAGLSGHVYSEEEADAFKESAPKHKAGPYPGGVEPTTEDRQRMSRINEAAEKKEVEVSARKERQAIAPPPPPGPPAQKGPPAPAIQKSKVGAVDVIRAYLVDCGGEASRGSVLKATGLSPARFHTAISKMRNAGEVAMFGQKRGATWKMLSGMTVEAGSSVEEDEPQEQQVAAPPLEVVPEIEKPEETSAPSGGTLATEDMVREFTDRILNSGVNFIELANVTRECTGFSSVREAHTHNVMTVEAMDKISAALA